MDTSPISRTFYGNVSKTAVCGYAAILSLVYIVVVVQTPIGIYSAQQIDDALFMRLGQSLADGYWLGSYNELTLLKGPGYPAFLALGNWLGMSASLARALFHCGCVLYFVFVAHKAHRSILISGLLFSLLLWHPISITAPLLRILREQVFSDQILLVLAAIAWSLFFAIGLRQKLIAALFAGVVLGWTWLTREEGLTIILMLLPLVVIAIARATRPLATIGVLTAIFATFATMQIGYRAINYSFYGAFIGVQTKSPGYLHALRELHSVRSGGIKPYISMTNEAMERVYAVSPAFASLQDYWKGHPGNVWRATTCAARPDTCGEIVGGWFMHGLMIAAAQKGHHESPAKAEAFYEKIANEVSQACYSGKLECERQLLPEMPPATWRQIVSGLWKNVAPAIKLLLYKQPPRHFVISQRVAGDNYESYLEFLNFPNHTAPMIYGSNSKIYTLSGWYRRAGSQWFSAQVREFGTVVPSHLDRLPSPDIKNHFNDNGAAYQRFGLRFQCGGDDCVVRFQGQNTGGIEKSLSDLRSGTGFFIGDAQLYIDFLTSEPGVLPVLSPQETLANVLRQGLISCYEYIALPLFTIGIAAFVAMILFWLRTALSSLTFIIAVTCWLGVSIRIGLVLLVDVTSFPAVKPDYLAPAYYLLVAASLFSCAALIKIWIGDRAAPTN